MSLSDAQPLCKAAMIGVVKRLLARAGITGPQAHAHAFRKGVVTALLKEGNTLHSVSRFVHHKSSAVTEKSYDKRTYAEVVDKMIIPLQWRQSEAVDDIAEQDVAPPEEEEATTTSGSVSSANRVAAMALMDEMAANERLRQENEILVSLLTPEQRRRYEGEQRRVNAE